MGFDRNLLGKKIERLLLIYPPVTYSAQSMKQCHLPLGISYIAAVMRDVCEVSVLDAAVEGYDQEERIGDRFFRYGLSFDEIQKRIARIKPDLVGISCIFSSQFQNSLEVARRAKLVDPGIITVVGGSHPTFLFKESLEPGGIDFIVRGEGEFALRELVESVRKGQGPEQVPGLAWSEEGGIKESVVRPVHAGLDDIPFPARDLFPVKKYDKISVPMGTVYKRRPFMNLITSRGCPHRCTFCSSTNFWGNKYRVRSPKNVLDEMEELVFKYGIREFKFLDDNLTANVKRAKEIFRGMIDRKLGVSWNTPNGVHIANLDEEMLDLMKGSGCYELTLAVESGDQTILKEIINKPTDLEQVVKASKMMRRKGIGSHGFFIIGFPGETMQQIRNTLDFSRRLDLDRISCFIANPLPGTELLRVCREKGYIGKDYRFDQIDYFEGRFDTKEWSHDQIHEMRRSWFWKYNLGLLFRHPIGFFSRYKMLATNPRLLLEIFARRINS